MFVHHFERALPERSEEVVFSFPAVVKCDTGSEQHEHAITEYECL